MSNIQFQIKIIITNYESRIKILPKGFTLIELLLAMTLVISISAVSMLGFSRFNSNQQLKNAIYDVTLVLSQAKSKAQTQARPDIPACVTGQLESYKVRFSANTYELDVVCQGATVAVELKTLPSGMTFDISTTYEFIYPILNGSVNSGTVKILGNGSEATITVDKMGNISQ